MTRYRLDLSNSYVRVTGIVICCLIALLRFCFLLIYPHYTQDYMPKPKKPQNTYAAYTSAECRALQEQATRESVPLQNERQRVNEEQNRLLAKNSSSLAAGYYEDGTANMNKRDKAEYDRLGALYLSYTKQLEAIADKYACK